MYLYKLEFSSLKDALCQVWLKLPSDSGDYVNIFLRFYNYLPFKKSVALHLNTLESLIQVLSSEGSLACNTYSDTGQPFIMVISEEL